MKAKLLLLALMTIIVVSITSCAYVDPRTQYPPTYRTYQDRDHGGIEDQYGGIHQYR